MFQVFAPNSSTFNGGSASFAFAGARSDCKGENAMIAPNRQALSLLEHLVETCRDGEQELRRAATKLPDNGFRALCDAYAGQYATFAAELELEIGRLGGRARAPRRNDLEQPGWIHLAHKGTGEDASCIETECELGESASLRSYEEVLAHELPAEVRSMLVRQYAELKRAYERARAYTGGV
jgi:uncharacterized protein (TIGR02284 family)